MIEEHDSVVIEDERIPYEECMQPVYHNIEEIGDGDILMLCSYQHNRGMPEEISIGTSESHIFETNYWCMTAGIEAHLDDVFMQVVKHRMDALRRKGKIRIGPLTEEYVHCCEAEHKIILEKDGAEEGLAESLMNSWESSDQQNNMLIKTLDYLVI